MCCAKYHTKDFTWLMEICYTYISAVSLNMPGQWQWQRQEMSNSQPQQKR